MMAGGPIDVYSRLRRTGAPSAVGKAREGFPTFRVQPASWRSRAPPAESSFRNSMSAALVDVFSRPPGCLLREAFVTEVKGHHLHYDRRHSFRRNLTLRAS